jgi:hypothetical protein
MAISISDLKHKLKRTPVHINRILFGVRETYLSCSEHCGRLQSAGVALDRDDLVDFSAIETTPDQLRIETVLKTLDWQGTNVLHVGVGNSKFAKNFSSELNCLDGITVSVNERTNADQLGITNYRVHLVSKYDRDLLLTATEKYDFIIDNNLAGFACCKFHFHQMMDTYLWVLKSGGRILTDQAGMNWAFEDPRWVLTYQDLVGMEKLFPMKVSKLTDTVYSLQRL